MGTPNTKIFEIVSQKATRAFLDAGLHGIDAEVVVAVDVSWRMRSLYADGSMQRIVEALLALALKFDDDGVVPIWAFGKTVRPLGTVEAANAKGIIQREVVRRSSDLQPECKFAPIITAIAKKHFPVEWGMKIREKRVGGALKRRVWVYPPLQSPRPRPIFVIVVTAGDCLDPAIAAKRIRRASHLPIFWQFCGLSPPGLASEFEFLKRLDSLKDTHVDSCGFFKAPDPNDLPLLFSGLLNEFPQYLRLPKVRTMILPPRERTHGSDDAQPVHDPVDELIRPTDAEAERLEKARRARQMRRRLRGLIERIEASEQLTDEELAFIKTTDGGAFGPKLSKQLKQARELLGLSAVGPLPPPLPPPLPTAAPRRKRAAATAKKGRSTRPAKQSKPRANAPKAKPRRKTGSAKRVPPPVDPTIPGAPAIVEPTLPDIDVAAVVEDRTEPGLPKSALLAAATSKHDGDQTLPDVPVALLEPLGDDTLPGVSSLTVDDLVALTADTDVADRPAVDATELARPSVDEAPVDTSADPADRLAKIRARRARRKTARTNQHPKDA